MLSKEETLAMMFSGDGAEDDEVGEDGEEDVDMAQVPITVQSGPNMKMALVVNDELSMKRGKAGKPVVWCWVP